MAGRHERLAHREVAVTAHEIQRHAGSGQGRKAVDYSGVGRQGAVVADPYIEQIAEHVDGLGRAGRAVQIANQALGVRVVVAGEMDIGK